MKHDHTVITSGHVNDDDSTQPSASSKSAMAALREQRLPFTIRIVNDEQALQKAVRIRHAAYSRHLPELARNLSQFEPADLAQDTIILLAESKLDGSSLGTMRIQTNHDQPLVLEQSVTLPAWLRGQRLAEATRLGVTPGQVGKMVKTLLFKAYFLYCVENEIDWMVITARSPLDRQYDALLFQDVFAGGQFIPMQHVGMLPHRVMAFEVATARERWSAAVHPLFSLMFEMRHADLMLDQPPDFLAASQSGPSRGHLHGRGKG
ncbi:N-acyl amino acid synthase FeeM domain-containing protein [Collimonas humicola]|uniref:N-acyl amino acid synthase FeeM domain-containing protein n=1 Tax=Collimonas humicola TaxID=2825886 RepID=UPI001B8AE0B2|nr:hypothetical protein [Collimonas humicola]